ncbi:MAG: haloacid dehalogenase-like hydrolase [Erysipelotrichaceae bacterium]|nr:haloacid dehalogenase-like hydrolase [Erysipelotrichaceae bacterium]
MKVQCAFFDFDNTITHGDSIYRLLRYTLKKHPLSILRYIKTGILGLGMVFHLVSMETSKSALIYPLDIFTPEELKKFFNEQVVPSYYPHMVEELQKRHDEGCMVFLVTASEEAYMIYNELPIDVLMATKTEKKGDRYTSKIVGLNCKGANKVTIINDYLKAHDLEIDYERSYGYSDSKSDIPMLKLVKNRYRVSKKDGSLSEFVC